MDLKKSSLNMPKHSCPRLTFSFNCCSYRVLILETYALRRELIVASQKTTLLCFCLVYLRFWITINKTQLLFILPQKLIEKNWWSGHSSKRSTWIKLRSLLVLYFCAQENFKAFWNTLSVVFTRNWPILSWFSYNST